MGLDGGGETLARVCVCGLAGCAEVRARAAKNVCTWAWLAAKAERQRLGGQARQGRGGLGSAQGKEWRRARRGERRNKTPRVHTGSVNHVRLCAIRPSFFPLSSVSSRVFGDVAGAAAAAAGPAGRLVEQVQRSFFFFFSFSLVVRVGCYCYCYCSCSCWSCSTCQGLLAQLFSFGVPMRTALTCIGGRCGEPGWRRGRSATGKGGPAGLGTASTDLEGTGYGGCVGAGARVGPATCTMHMCVCGMCTCAFVRVEKPLSLCVYVCACACEGEMCVCM